MLLEIRIRAFIPCGPGIVVHDRVAPRERPHAAVLDVVIFLDRAVQLADGRGQHARREAGEVVREEFDGVLNEDWRAGGEDPRQQQVRGTSPRGDDRHLRLRVYRRS